MVKPAETGGKMKPSKKQPKYKNKKVTIDGVTYDSLREYHRFCELKRLERAGEISNLQRQVKYILVPSQKLNGKVVERSVSYAADFVYHDKSGNLIVEDSKGYRNPASAGYAKFVIKRKLMLYVHGIQIKEV